MIAAICAIAGVGVGVAGAIAWRRWQRRRTIGRPHAIRRIAFPFTADALAEPALRTALRVARAEGATLMPVYLALVPRELPLDCALPTEANIAMPLLETIEQRAARADVEVDARIERGRTLRHALAQLTEHEGYDRMVVAAAATGDTDGFPPEDIAWLLERAPAEIMVLRTARPSPAASNGAARAGV